MRIVLIGPPGSHVTDLANRLAESNDIPKISISELLNQTAAEDSDLGKMVKESVNLGRVSDDLVLALLKSRLNQKDTARGFVLEDFPCTPAQAEILDDHLESINRSLDLFVLMEVDSDELMERLVGHIICDECGTEYNLYANPPMVDGACDVCGARLIRRPKGYEDTFSNKLRVFDTQMGSLSDRYAKLDKMRRVDGNQDDEEILTALQNLVLEARSAAVKRIAGQGKVESIDKSAAKKGGRKKSATRARKGTRVKKAVGE
jgi:adenylate kinase